MEVKETHTHARLHVTSLSAAVRYKGERDRYTTRISACGITYRVAQNDATFFSEQILFCTPPLNTSHNGWKSPSFQCIQREGRARSHFREKRGIEKPTRPTSTPRAHTAQTSKHTMGRNLSLIQSNTVSLMAEYNGHHDRT